MAAIGGGLLAFQFIPYPDFKNVAGPNPTDDQIFVVLLLISLFAGTAIFFFLNALEWVYRGFRPLSSTPSGETTFAPEYEHVEPTQELRPALPHLDKRWTSEPLTPSQEFQHREFSP